MPGKTVKLAFVYMSLCYDLKRNNKPQVILIVWKLLSFYCFFYLMLTFQDIVKDRKKIGLGGMLREKWRFHITVRHNEYLMSIIMWFFLVNIQYRKVIHFNLGNTVKAEYSKYEYYKENLLMKNTQNDKLRWESDMFTSSMI